jgi:1-acyl-sn-glycerol-3-phosphate acyltransferase
MLRFLSYIRAFFITPFAVAWTLLSSVLVLCCVGFGFSKQTLFYLIKNVWVRVILFVSGVEVETKGREHLPDGGFLYVFNHTSHFDILVIFLGTPRICYFGAKAELFAIPIFGRAMHAGGALRIERANRNKVMQVYKEAEARVAQGDIFTLAPEGTRQPGHGSLGPFKTGPFVFAANAKMPIVPVVLVGCEKVMSKKDIFVNWGQWKQKVVFECLEPIYPMGESDEEVRRMRDLAYDRMSKKLKEYWAPAPI